MVMKQGGELGDEDITPQSAYFNRRTFLRAGILAASVATRVGL